jgi:hypothetical protein
MEYITVDSAVGRSRVMGMGILRADGADGRGCSSGRGVERTRRAARCPPVAVSDL